MAKKLATKKKVSNPTREEEKVVQPTEPLLTESPREPQAAKEKTNSLAELTQAKRVGPYSVGEQLLEVSAYAEKAGITYENILTFKEYADYMIIITRDGQKVRVEKDVN